MKKILIICCFLALSLNISQAKERNLDSVSIITRSQWWADESIRFKDSYSQKTDSTSTSTDAQSPTTSNAQMSAERAAYMKKNFLNDWTYDKVQTTMDGHTLIYPDQINNHKTKIVVHHTATTYSQSWDENQIQKAVQQIYKYHTLDRDFGDIWYNFLIDHLGNIYEWRAGGEGAAGMHVSYNNVATVWVALLWNFEEYAPTQAQINALTDLLTALVKRYNIDPSWMADYFQPTNYSPYISSKKLPTIAGHWDIAATACPWEVLDELLPFIRSEVVKRKNGWTSSEVVLNGVTTEQTSNSTFVNTGQNTVKTAWSGGKSFSEKLKLVKLTQQPLLQKVIDLVRSRYTGKLVSATVLSEKITYKIKKEEIKNLILQDISVLLYELTTKYNTFEVFCEGWCEFLVDWQTYNFSEAKISRTPTSSVLPYAITLSNDNFTTIAQEIIVSSANNLIQIVNYDRKSYAGIPRNTFHWKLIFKTENYKTIDGILKNDYVVINQLSFSDYLKGIVESNDTETLEKNKVMALISKNYALFYLASGNIHPSIPQGASFQAIDSPEMFQKYVGEGAEKTLIKWYQAIEETKNLMVMYEWFLPILPYFSCSAGWTLSAEEKRWWKDTPYLKSVFDFSSCKDFNGHWVGLAGQGAEYFAKQWMKAEEILDWYYDGIEVVTF